MVSSMDDRIGSSARGCGRGHGRGARGGRGRAGGSSPPPSPSSLTEEYFDYFITIYENPL
jgi:hypothetical protein